MTISQLLTASAHALPLAARSVQCIVTSTPYFGLRAYDGNQAVEWPAVTYRLNEWTPAITVDAWRGGLGSEPDPVMYVGHLILCLREWHRVLRDDGVVFLNLGDSYSNDTKWGGTTGGKHVDALHGEPVGRGKRSTGLKGKDLIGIPWLVAFAARADGWWLRSDIIWAKKSPMPGSQQDRPTNAHEYIFLLAKSADYFWDQEAVKQPFADARQGRDGSQRPSERNVGGRTDGYTKPNGIDPSAHAGATIRTVWDLGPDPYPGQHYAVFPREIPRRTILAGTSAAGCCPKCNSPWQRIVARANPRTGADYKASPHTPKMADLSSAQPGYGDQEIIYSPTGSRSGDDPSMQTGRAGMNRPRGKSEGQRPITRYEQRHYAAQLRKSPQRAEMESAAGSAFAHYLRTDMSGARPIPDDLLQDWITRGWLDRVAVPKTIPQMLKAPAEPSEPDPDDAAPAIACRNCEGRGQINTEPLFAAAIQTCPVCSGSGLIGGDPGWWTWQAEHAAWQVEDARIFAANVAAVRQVAALNLPLNPCTVLDPFSGAGTTAAAAVELGRTVIGVDIHAGYNAEHAARRIERTQPALIAGGL